MPAALSQSEYQALVNEIAAIYARSQREAKELLDKLRSSTYWEIGRRIVTVEQNNKLRADYGKKLLENLSRDLSERLGKGFSLTNLKYMRRFYLSYPSIGQTSDQLPWSAYQVLSTVKDSQKRAELTKKAAQFEWSTRDLKSALRRENVEMEEIGRQGPETEIREGKKPAARLKAALGRFYTYRLIFKPTELTRVPGDESRQGKYLVDLGFDCWRDAGTRGLKSVQNDMTIEAAKSGQVYSLKESAAAPNDLYNYRAVLEKVIDGDTLKCLIDLGFGVWTTQKLRLRAIDCPEIAASLGRAARAFVEDTVKGRPLSIKTHKSDKYDRYLADVWAGDTYLNQALLDKGLAGVYAG